MSCFVRVDDGINPPVHMEDGVDGLDVVYDRVPGGGSIRRFLSGRAVKQTRFQKKKITVTGSKMFIPTGLRDLDYSQPLTVDIGTGLGVETFTCVTEPGASETWGLKSARVTWSIVLEEA